MHKVSRVDLYVGLIERLERLAVRADSSSGDAELLAEIEDALSAGYADALSGEGRLVQLEDRLDALLNSSGEARAEELRRIVTEHRALERSVARLRAALEPLRRQFVALGGASVSAR
jgi:hypothetical protein